MTAQPLLVIAAGGTGGHMFPAQALAETMLGRGWAVRLSTDARGATHAGGFPRAVVRKVVRSGSFARGSLASRALVPVNLVAGTLAAVWEMLRRRPSCVVGFGGYPAIPAVAAATLLRIPRILHEQNGVLGRVNELFARRVNAVACGTWPTRLPRGVKGLHVGNPVRQTVREKAGAPYQPPLNGNGPITLLVFGGSQGASVMSIVPKALAELDDSLRGRIRVAHQARNDDAECVRAAYAALGVTAEVKPFFTDIAERMEAAQLLICRAGASSVADLTVIGRPAILIPLAIALRDEQSANAAPLAQAGAAVVIVESELTAQGLAGHIAAIMTDPGKAAKAAKAALALGKPEAAETLADLVIRVSRGETV